jgi:8-oxo-dGTP pyrophosphatase MutT (NUDIX family)
VSPPEGRTGFDRPAPGASPARDTRSAGGSTAHPPSSAALRAALGRFEPGAPADASAAAAVLAVLRVGRHDVEALLLERAARPRDPASGQISLPGGRRDAADASLLETALREFEEEVGLARDDLDTPPRYVGTFPARAFGIDVAAFAATLGPQARSPFARSATEVADVFWLPLSALDRSELVSRETPSGALRVEAIVHGRYVVWGFTHRVLLAIRDRLRSA